MSEDGKAMIMMILWQLWGARNRLVFEGIEARHEGVLSQAYANLREFHTAMGIHAKTAATWKRQHWQAPTSGHYKLNVDAACKVNTSGLGAIVRDGAGEIIAAMAAPIHHGNDPQFLEASAISRAIQFIMDLGLQQVWIESDCKAVVNSINTPGTDFSDIGHIIKQIKVAMHNPIILGINHVSRTANVPADRLANLACHLDSRQVWIEDGPFCVVEACLSDLNQ